MEWQTLAIFAAGMLAGWKVTILYLLFRDLKQADKDRAGWL